jgi:hypothetical protein
MFDTSNTLALKEKQWLLDENRCSSEALKLMYNIHRAGLLALVDSLF